MPLKPQTQHSEFLISAVKPDGYPPPEKPEIAMAGRSNAGKSTLLNQFLGRSLARVSNTPGKTQLLNFYSCGDHYRLVDLPGYGFSKQTQKKMYEWDRMIQAYLKNRENLAGVIIVMDIRRDWEDFEEMLAQWLKGQKRPYLLALTKADKLSEKKKNDRVKQIKIDSMVDDIFVCSSLRQEGIKEIENFVFNEWVKK